VTIGEHTVTLREELAIGALETLRPGAAVVPFNRRD